MVRKKEKRSLKSRALRVKILVLMIFFVIIFFWEYSQLQLVSLEYLDQQGISHTLTLPVKDRKKLAGLMQKLFAQDSFAYTILGSKPISWVTYLNHLPTTGWRNFYNSFSEYHRTISSGWKTWEKYQHFFPQSHLWKETSKRHPGWFSILIINEDDFNVIVNKNKKDFQEVLCREIVDGFQLIQEAKNRSLIDEVLQGHQGLIGIVLGYGRDNAWQFLEGCKNRMATSWVWEGTDISYHDLESNILLTDYFLSRCSCPSFAGDPHSVESIGLKRDYTLAKQKVLAYYKNKDFLEATLSLLAGYLPECFPVSQGE